nr:glycosyltransferase family 4 protein [Psychroflexus tropicus]
MPKKLLIISYDFPPSTGGIARLCHEIATHIQSNYESVEVLTLEKNKVSVPYNDNPEIKINYLPSKRILSEVKALQFLKKWKHKPETDVICGTWHPDAALSIFSGFKNVFALAHGTELLYGQSKFRKYLWLPFYAKWISGKSKKVIANSQYTKNLVLNINPKAEVIALPLGVNPEFFCPKPKSDLVNHKLKICTVSRILQFKGHDFILKALSELPESYRDQVEWHIAGSGPFLEELIELVNESSIKNQIQFHGFVKDEDLPAFYSNSDLFILATRETKESTQVEGFGLVFLEAQACGTPVIGTNTGGIPDAIEYKNGGWLIEQDNQYELSQLIKQLIDNSGILKVQSRLARERILQKCSWQVYVDNLKQIIQ